MPSPADAHTGRTADAPRRQASVSASLWSSPVMFAALLTAGAFAVLLLVLRPGYWINDDLKIIWNLAGYPGVGENSLFPVYSNVLLGLVLAPLYAARTSANWWVLLLVLLNACSTYSLLWLVAAARRLTLLRILGCTAILLGFAALTLNVTYTLTALLASVAGILLVWAASRESEGTWMLPAAAGCVLILAGALLRLQMLLLSVLLALPMLVASRTSLQLRRFIAVSAVAGALVLLAASFDRLYVRASPDWNYFYAYTRVRQQVHDSHRLNNVHNEIRRAGWTANDQELFAHWFYPDEQVYSLEKLQYLVDEVPPQSQDFWGSMRQFVGQLQRLPNYPYLLWMVAMASGALAAGIPRRTVAVVLLTWAIALGANLVLTVIYKDPDYVLSGSLAGSLAISTAYLLGSSAAAVARRAPRPGTAPVKQFLVELTMVLFLLGGVALLGNAFARSSLNVARQRDYARFRSELEGLLRDGILADDALIVSPAHGLPYEWSNPLALDLPSPPYLDTGWITFSPAYYRVLDEYGITSLPEALVSQENVYLMAESGFTAFLSRFYQERAGYPVTFESLYEMHASPGLLAGDAVHLYKLAGAR